MQAVIENMCGRGLGGRRASRAPSKQSCRRNTLQSSSFSKSFHLWAGPKPHTITPSTGERCLCLHIKPKLNAHQWFKSYRWAWRKKTTHKQRGKMHSKNFYFFFFYYSFLNKSVLTTHKVSALEMSASVIFKNALPQWFFLYQPLQAAKEEPVERWASTTTLPSPTRPKKNMSNYWVIIQQVSVMWAWAESCSIQRLPLKPSSQTIPKSRARALGEVKSTDNAVFGSETRPDFHYLGSLLGSINPSDRKARIRSTVFY